MAEPSVNPTAAAGHATRSGFEDAEVMLVRAAERGEVVLKGIDTYLFERDSADPSRTKFTFRAAVRPDGKRGWELALAETVSSLRAALNYAAFEVYERVCCEDVGPRPHGHRVPEFPIPPQDSTTDEYAKRVLLRLPGLDAQNRELFDLILTFLRYAQGDECWLATLDAEWNKAKHRSLPVVWRKEVLVHISTPSGLVDGPPLDWPYFDGPKVRNVGPIIATAVREVPLMVAAMRVVLERTK